eukprot:Nk52_evm24s211 gene=Nk52_evmTU24s211
MPPTPAFELAISGERAQLSSRENPERRDLMRSSHRKRPSSALPGGSRERKEIVSSRNQSGTHGIARPSSAFAKSANPYLKSQTISGPKNVKKNAWGTSPPPKLSASLFSFPDKAGEITKQDAKQRPYSAKPPVQAGKVPWGYARAGGAGTPQSSGRSRPSSAPRLSSKRHSVDNSKAIVPVFDMSKVDEKRKKNETPRSFKGKSSCRMEENVESLALVPYDELDKGKEEIQGGYDKQLVVGLTAAELTPPLSWEMEKKRGNDSERSWGSWQLEEDGHYTPRNGTQGKGEEAIQDGCDRNRNNKSRGASVPSVPIPKLRLELVGGTKPVLTSLQVKKKQSECIIENKEENEQNLVLVRGAEATKALVLSDDHKEPLTPRVSKSEMSQKSAKSMSSQSTSYLARLLTKNYLKVNEESPQGERSASEKPNTLNNPNTKQTDPLSLREKSEPHLQTVEKQNSPRAQTYTVAPQNDKNDSENENWEEDDSRKVIKAVEKVPLIATESDKQGAEDSDVTPEHPVTTIEKVEKMKSSANRQRPSSASSVASFFYESEYKANTGGVYAPINLLIENAKHQTEEEEKAMQKVADKQLELDQTHSIVSIFRMGETVTAPQRPSSEKTARSMEKQNLQESMLFKDPISHVLKLKATKDTKRPQSAKARSYNPLKYTGPGSSNSTVANEKFRFSVRMLSSNGRDIHRDLVGYFFGDGTLTIYEFRKLSNRCVIAPLIKRGCYLNLFAKTGGMPYTIIDIRDGGDIVFLTKGHNALPDYIKEKTFVSFRVNGIDYQGKSKLMALQNTVVQDVQKKRPHDCSESELKEIQKKVRHKLSKHGPAKVIALNMALESAYKRHALQGSRLSNIFWTVIQQHNVGLNEQEFRTIWKNMLHMKLQIPNDNSSGIEQLEIEKSANVDNEEFFRLLVGEMRETRKAIVRKAFTKLDSNKNGFLETSEIKKYICDNGGDECTPTLSLNEDKGQQKHYRMPHKTSPYSHNVHQFFNILAESQGKRAKGDSGVKQVESFITCNSKISFMEFESYYEAISMAMAEPEKDDIFSSILCNTWGCL